DPGVLLGPGAHPADEFAVIELMVFYKGNGGNGCFHPCKPSFLPVYLPRYFIQLPVAGMYARSIALVGNNLPLHHHAVVEVQGGADDNTQAYLPDDLRYTRQPVTVFFLVFLAFGLCFLPGFDFKIIIEETDSTQPYGAQHHKADIYFVEIGK